MCSTIAHHYQFGHDLVESQVRLICKSICLTGNFKVTLMKGAKGLTEGVSCLMCDEFDVPADSVRNGLAKFLPTENPKFDIH